MCGGDVWCEEVRSDVWCEEVRSDVHPSVV